MQPSPQRRVTILWFVILATIFAVVFWQHSGIPFPERQLSILIVVLGTAAGAMNLYRGILLGFSKRGGWGAAAVPLLWSGVMLILSYNALASPGEREHGVPLSLLAAALAIAASVLSQRHGERLDWLKER